MNKKSFATNHCCPLCNRPLLAQWGNQSHPGDKDYGVTLFCQYGDSDARKHPQEVSGHGNGRSDESALKNAYTIIQAKFCGARLETEGELREVDTTEAEPEITEEPKKGKRKTRQIPPVVELEDAI